MRAATTTTAAILLAFSATPATAEKLSSEKREEVYDRVTDVCSELSKAAEGIMTRRQEGVPMRRLMANLAGDRGAAIVREAYNTPAYTTEEHQQRAITRFGNRVYGACYDNLTETLRGE